MIYLVSLTILLAGITGFPILVSSLFSFFPLTRLILSETHYLLASISGFLVGSFATFFVFLPYLDFFFSETHYLLASISVFPILVGIILIFLWVLVHQLNLRYRRASETN